VDDVGQLGAVAVMAPTHQINDLFEQLWHGELCSLDLERMDKAGAVTGPARTMRNELKRNA
jgi:hypothetical protein